LAEIAYIFEHKLHEHAAELGDYTLKRLNNLKDKHPLIGHVAGLGLHIGIDLVSDRKTRERAVDEAEIIMFKCLEKGLSSKTIEGNVLTLRPALVISQEEMDRAIDIIDEAIGEGINPAPTLILRFSLNLGITKFNTIIFSDTSNFRFQGFRARCYSTLNPACPPKPERRRGKPLNLISITISYTKYANYCFDLFHRNIYKFSMFR
jgi:hypothetical protein